MAESVDVLVIGAGPAGSTVARLLAQRGYSVLLFKGPQPRTPVIGTLPPSINDIFAKVGIQAEIEDAGFSPACGETIWWADSTPSIENYGANSRGYHVDRVPFDGLLLSLAERAGVEVRRNTRAPRVELNDGAVQHDSGVSNARFIVDASGRSGMLARQIKRYWDPRYRNIGLCGIYKTNSPWNVASHHMLIEAYDRGWAWSIPLAANRRYVTFIADAGDVRTGIEQAFLAELSRTVQFAELFENCELEETPWSRDATQYYADRYAGPNWILVGDAGSFADPLMSCGVQKAMESAWTGAWVIDTCLSNPEAADTAIESFNQREAEVWLHRAHSASQRYGKAVPVFRTPFWTDRAKPPDGC